MANYLLRRPAPHTDMHRRDGPLPASRNPLVRLQRGFERRFERTRLGYRELLAMALPPPRRVCDRPSSAP